MKTVHSGLKSINYFYYSMRSCHKNSMDTFKNGEVQTSGIFLTPLMYKRKAFDISKLLGRIGIQSYDWILLQNCHFSAQNCELCNAITTNICQKWQDNTTNCPNFTLSNELTISDTSNRFQYAFGDKSSIQNAVIKEITKTYHNSLTVLVRFET